MDPRTRKEKVSRKALLDKPEGYVERPPRDDSRGRGDRDSRGRGGDRDRNRGGDRDRRRRD